MKLLSTKLIYIIGAIVLSATVFVGTFFAVSALGGFDDFGNELVIEVSYGEKEYSGSAQTCEEFEIKEGEIREGHTLKVVSAPKLTYPDSVKNELVLGVFNQDGEDVSDSYKIEYKYNDFKIVPLKLNLKSESREELYNKDADPITTTGLYVQDELIEGEEIELSTGDVIKVNYPSFLDAGIHENKPEISIINAEGQDVSSSYQLNFEYGNIEIKQFTLKFETESKQKEYDGEPLSSSEIKIISGEQEGHYYKAKKSTVKSITDVPLDGKGIKNKFDIIVTDEEGTDITHAYLFDGDYGELNILKRPVELKTFDLEKVYDATPLSYLDAPTLLGNIGYEIKYSGEDETQTQGIIGEQHVYVIGEEDEENCYAEQIYAGIEENSLKVKIYTDETLEIETSYNYDITYVYGELTVLQRNLGEFEDGVIALGKDYDGNNAFTATFNSDSGINLVSSDALNLECNSSSEYAGVYVSSKRQVEITLFNIKNQEGVDVTNCYNLQELTLVIADKIKVYVQVNNGEPIKIITDDYNATDFTDAHENLAIFVSGNANVELGDNCIILENGDKLYITITPFDTELFRDQYDMEVSATIMDGDGNDVTKNYILEISPGYWIMR